VRALTKATIGTKRDGLKTDVELLVSDDGVGAIVLGLIIDSDRIYCLGVGGGKPQTESNINDLESDRSAGH
jgi:hypothetical protein